MMTLFSIPFALIALAATSYADTCPTCITLAIGSYTGQPWLPTAAGVGITLAQLRDGDLSTFGTLAPEWSGENPSYLAIAPPHIYAANENDPDGSVTRITFSSSAPFLRRDSRQTMDSGTTHLAVMQSAELQPANSTASMIIVAANYAGSVTSFTATHSNFKLADTFTVPTELASQTTNASLTDQQAGPHPHMALPYERGVIVPDLGSDLVWYLGVDEMTGQLSELQRVSLEPGDGPRHAVAHASGTVYIVNEISVSLVVLRADVCGVDGLGLCERHELLDGEVPEGTSAAAIRLSADGRFLYVSVRLDEADGKIVAFALDEAGGVEGKIGQWSSGGVHPRDFFVVEDVQVDGECKSFLGVVNRDSDNLVLLERSRDSGEVAGGAAAFEMKVATPTSVVAC